MSRRARTSLDRSTRNDRDARGPDRGHDRPGRRGWRIRDGQVDLSVPRIVGIINVTPDSFSDGGRFLDSRVAVEQGLRLVEEGADLLDVGGESTRPGAGPIPADEELRRVLPVVEELAGRVSVPICIDTTKSVVARRAIEAGARVVNDVSALRVDPQLGEVVGGVEVGIVLMHMRGTPRTMQDAPFYEDTVGEIHTELGEAVRRAREAGIADAAIVLDPGIGFGKRLDDNYRILTELERLTELGFPLMVGPSRKSFIGQVTGAPAGERLGGTVAACLLALRHGASLLRVHDVKVVKQAVDVWLYAEQVASR